MPCQAYVLPKLYPAVLWGVVGLQRLSLHHFEEYCFTELPAPLVSSLRVSRPVSSRQRLVASCAIVAGNAVGQLYTKES